MLARATRIRADEYMSRRRNLRQIAQTALAGAIFALALWLAWRALRPYSFAAILQSLTAISARQVALCLVFTAASLLCLTGSDALAVRYAGRRLAYRRIALASFTSIAIGHTLGFAVVSSGALRYRFYTAWGLSQGDVGRVLLACGITVTVGILSTLALTASVQPTLTARTFGIDGITTLALAGACAALVVIYLAFATLRTKPLRIRDFELPPPGWRIAAGQVLVGTTDQFLVAAALFQMLPESEVGYLAVATTYAAANAAAVIAHVPGGLGVIEAVFVSFLPGAPVLGAVVAFRALYFVLPFFAGCIVLALAEIARRRVRT